MSEFWLLSVPGVPSKESAVQKTNEAFAKVAQVFPLSLPEVKVPASPVAMAIAVVETIGATGRNAGCPDAPVG